MLSSTVLLHLFSNSCVTEIAGYSVNTLFLYNKFKRNYSAAGLMGKMAGLMHNYILKAATFVYFHDKYIIF